MRIKRKLQRCAVFTAMSAAFFTPQSQAHHSFALFDSQKTIAIEGTLYSVEWKSPHGWFWISVPNAKGGTDVWGLEGAAPAEFVRQGLSKKDFTVGTKVIVDIHPLKDGRTGGQFLRMTFPDGRQVGSLKTPEDVFKEKGFVK